MLLILTLGIDIESDFINKDNINSIWNYIKNINITSARIFYFYFILDMSFKEISEELSMNESTVKSCLYRLLRNIKSKFLGGIESER